MTAILKAIKDLVWHTPEGKSCWNQYILSEAQAILAAKGGARGQGNYFNARSITPDFFSDESKAACTKKLVTEDMPFLYNLILNKVQPHRPAPSPVLATKGPTPS
ncbi:hypothetical protein PTTG_26234 [Puccinia triticina 1-1 BBBD Race 1]|uniref:Uncharacterized protein n=1 Tax=Puccinia triticina (isolate 1-1 / race 1 (BBBD)) TaxID=630390 RepID=A0A180GWL9_PUCT1|nr:hypothetical protein PTTG_26234 [Puccinia triticina 1-1 BBBD Race 1]